LRQRKIAAVDQAADARRADHAGLSFSSAPVFVALGPLRSANQRSLMRRTSFSCGASFWLCTHRTAATGMIDPFHERVRIGSRASDFHFRNLFLLLVYLGEALVYALTP